MRLRKKPWIAKAIQVLKGEYILTQELEQYKGHWAEVLGKKDLALEIGCGRGRFITGMAGLYPEKGFIGVETQHDICYYPGQMTKELGLTNVKIVCGNAAYLEDWFEPGEIKALYLNFSDPWPKSKQAKRRLTHHNFLAKYLQVVGVGGHLRFKTDNKELFDFSLAEFRDFGMEIIGLSYDLHHSEYDNEVMTEYEQRFSALGKKINFCEAVFK
ncbi:MAG: tRNA (guanosine(46)-N7)-methyltransferase TrmB [Acidaminococcaceae bacterium]